MSERKYNRIFTIVIDSLGVGALEDAAAYGDAGTDTLGHISQNVDSFVIPNLQKLGMANLHPLRQVEPVEKPLGYFLKMKEASTGKDTMTGHWEMMGLHITKPFQTFTETGFPRELIEELSARTGQPAPAPLAGLRDKAVRFSQVVEKERMADAVRSLLG